MDTTTTTTVNVGTFATLAPDQVDGLAEGIAAAMTRMLTNPVEGRPRLAVNNETCVITDPHIAAALLDLETRAAKRIERLERCLAMLVLQLGEGARQAVAATLDVLGDPLREGDPLAELVTLRN